MARLPVVGGDRDNWGTVLNDYLSVEHNADGTLKLRGDGTLTASEITGAATLTNGVLTSSQVPETLPTKSVLGDVLDPSYQVPVATRITNVSVSSGSTSLTAAPGSFSPTMDGKSFWLSGGGPVLVSGSYAWQASPLVGTVTYVSSSQVTISASATTTVSGGFIVIGDTCSTELNLAIAAGRFRIPYGTDLLVGSDPIVIGDGQVLEGDHRTKCCIFSVAQKANVIVSAYTTGATVKNLTVYGNGFGSQPANQVPDAATATAFAAKLADSGCGITFGNVSKGLIEDVDVYHCGGDGVTANRNGIAGIYLTQGCVESRVVGCTTVYCRNGINEDNYFNPSGLDQYSPKDNTIDRCQTHYCRFGVAIDSGSLSRGAAIISHVSRYCVLYGIDIHSSNFVSVIAPRVEFCGSGYAAPGIQVYGSSSSVLANHVTIVSPICHANGTHGIKISDHTNDVKIIGGVCSRNFRHGIYINTNGNATKVIGTTVRNNGQGSDSPGTYDGLRITASSNVWILAHCVDDQGTPTQNYGIRADGGADLVVVDDGCTFSGNATGTVSLVGSSSRAGTNAKRHQVRLSAMGLKGESWNNSSQDGSFATGAGNMRAVLIGLLAGDVINSIYWQQTVAGSGVTVAKVGVWDTAGNLLASSADLSSTQPNSGTGKKGGALSASYTIPADGGYYIGYVMVGGTPPTVKGSSSTTGYGGLPLAGQSPESINNTSKTDIGALTITSSGAAPWIGWA